MVLKRNYTACHKILFLEEPPQAEGKIKKFKKKTQQTTMCFLLNVLEENSKKSQNIELVQPYQA